MKKADVVFLHSPSIYDFRKKAVIHGPISDVVPSGPIFEMYPIGFISLCGHLEKAGFSTRIINIANKMLNSLNYDPEKEIKNLKPKAFCFDLHWFPHVQGSLKIAEITKKHHPDVPIIFGGYSSTYFHKELINYPFIDFILKGDSTELPMVMLIKAIANGGDFSSIPNLTYKDNKGNIYHNEITYVPNSTDYVYTDYTFPIRKTFKFFDLNGYIPFQTWMKYPVTAIFLYRGCIHNCRTCGGSKFTCENTFNRKELAFKSPEKVAEELKSIESLINGPAFIIGDILQNGKAYADEILKEIKNINFKNHLAFEFFVPPSEEYIVKMKNAVAKYNVEISPESHDEEVRRAFGRPFNNEQIERAIAGLVKNNCNRIDLFFMTGLPKQTYKSVMETIDYCEYLLKKYGKDKTLYPFISPLAPFVDPGSEVWEYPEKYGYKFFARTVEEHRVMMENALSWKYFLNYETIWMTRDEIVHSTYEAGIRLNELKRKYGLISPKIAELVEKRAKTAIAYLEKIDSIIERGDFNGDEWKKISKEIKDINIHTICYKDELNWPVSFYKFNIFKILALIGKSAFKKLFGKKTAPVLEKN
ncbi:MAG: TIGR04190 family B12-binding domain/radical SAM domain protein [Proteobacteria bacterium]|nr:TIGR04190 family B12-binding domain/radical SAM domain protein [Pseudomonadota bacterium]